MVRIPSVTLNNGVTMPILGLGTSKSKPDELYGAICTAIEAGYRHIDCAFIYGNEEYIGNAIEAKIKDGTVERKDLFIVSKLWRSFNKPEHIEMCFNESLKRLKIDYFDLYLLHWPEAQLFVGMKREDLIKRDEQGRAPIDESVDYLDTWKAMKKFLISGKSRAIGVSNFNSYQISRLVSECDLVPAVNQIECHPFLNQEELVKLCQSYGITVAGYCPIGSADRQSARAAGPLLLDNAEIVKIAAKYGKSPAQLALRFNLDRGVAVMPKSVNPSRIVENMNVFDFELTEEDRKALLTLTRNQRMCPSPMTSHHKYYPFRENYSE